MKSRVLGLWGFAGLFPALGAAVAVVYFTRPETNLVDFTNADLETLMRPFGMKPFTPTVDSTTGFNVGGKNSTSLIETLTEINGKSIRDLEQDMRPGAASNAGFLGSDESLLGVLAADNRYVVAELGLTHQELAKHLLVMAMIGAEHLPKGEFLYHGRRFKAEGRMYMGVQESPFDDGTATGADFWVENLSNGKTLKFSGLIADMVERYGFYEGKGTPYRVDPREIIEVFDFLKAK
ncbi:MAG TPA: hypothetical protein VGX78_03570 [Pirellulales bacterium]|nr:hypothetical protein [Pirellulales bacterium]